MKTNKEKVLEYIEEYSQNFKSNEYPKLTTQFLSEQLGLQRTNLSSTLNQLVKEGLIRKVSGRPVLYQLEIVNDKIVDNFENLIGYALSLKEAVGLAKAAILYPQGSPQILLTAENGSGILEFTKSIYGFAMQSKIIKSNAPFIVFDCENYIENESMMSTKLFGSIGNKGIIHEAHQGILLIRNVHLMKGQSRNILFHLLEKISLPTLYEDLPQHYKCILICQVPRHLDKTVLDTYQKHLSFTIDIPSLAQRTFLERYQYIECVLKEEAKSLQKTITIHSSVLDSLILYQPTNEIRGLQNDIHKACAHSYARYHKSQPSIELLLSDFSNHVRKGMIYYKVNKEEIDNIINQNTQYSFTDKKVLKNSSVLKEENIYQTIHQKKKELKKQSMSEEDINQLVSLDLQQDFETYFNRLTTNIDSIQKLGKVVSPKLIQIVDKFLKEASIKLNKIFDEKILFGLCLHMNALIIPIHDRQMVSPEEKKRLIDMFYDYYELAQSLIDRMDNEFNIKINSDEVIFVMLFMMSGYQFTKQKRVSTLIAMHGNQGAFSIVNTIKTLTQQENIYSYDLSLDKSMSVAYEELKQCMIEADQGKGIILIYDMGSIRTMVDSIMVETGIEVRYIEMPLTLLGMVSVNKTNENSSLEETYSYLNEKFNDIQYLRKEQNQKALLIISPIKNEIEDVLQYLHQSFDIANYKIYTLNKTDLADIYNEIDSISRQSSIIGIISSYNLHLSQFSFLNIPAIFQKNAYNIYGLFKENDELNDIVEYMQEQFPTMAMEELKPLLITFLDDIPQALNIKIDMNQKVGLLIHIVCLIDKLQKHSNPSVNFVASRIIGRDKESVEIVKRMLKGIEEVVEVNINDAEVATIVSIIKKQ